MLVVTNALTAECYMSVVTTLRDAIFRSYLESVLSVSVKDLNKLLIFWSLCAYRCINHISRHGSHFSPWFECPLKYITDKTHIDIRHIAANECSYHPRNRRLFLRYAV